MRVAGLISAAVFVWVAAATGAEFEVATVKSSRPIESLGAGALIGMRIGSGRVSIAQASISQLIQYAYNLKNYQVSGPEWLQNLDSRFDVEAVLPGGATQDQVSLMLQALLASRLSAQGPHRDG